LGKRGWEEFELSQNLVPEFEDLRRVCQLYRYTLQHRCLELYLRYESPEIFAASADVHTTRPGQRQLTTNWPRAMPVLLPEVDQVNFFVEGSKVSRVVSWGVVQRVVPHLLERTEWLPARYRTRGFPTEEEFAQMQAVG
jgi:hypothetical protein